MDATIDKVCSHIEQILFHCLISKTRAMAKEALRQALDEATDTKDILPLLRIALLAKDEKSLSILAQRINVTDLPLHESLRLDIETGRPSLPPKVENYPFRWCDLFFNKKIDMIYPYTVKAIRVQRSTAAGENSFILIEKCLCCNGIYSIDPDIAQNCNIDLCPLCLAKKKMPNHGVKDALKNIIESTIRKIENSYKDNTLSTQELSNLFQLCKAIEGHLRVRFGVIRSERIGHFALNTELYMSERDAGIKNSDTFDILGFTHPVSNTAYKRMWERKLYCSPVAELMAAILPHDSPMSTHCDLFNNANNREAYALFDQYGPHAFLTDEETQQAWHGLNLMGISQEDRWVCLNVRDKAYLTHQFPHKNFNYHKFRDSDIETYSIAAQIAKDHGSFVLRMGARTQKPISFEDRRIIDYSRKFRTELLDIFLSANCHYFISTGTGIDAFPMVYRRPCVFVNFSQFNALPNWSARNITIFKKYWFKRESRMMTFREIFLSPVGGFGRQEEFDAAEISLIDNTPQEIADAILEMEARINGSWIEDEEDDNLQRQFWGNISHTGRHTFGRIGAQFLRDYRELLT